jgi:hypothetical protein
MSEYRAGKEQQGRNLAALLFLRPVTPGNMPFSVLVNMKNIFSNIK